MNENMKAWVEALRSGEYRQGKGALHELDEDGSSSFCCLGVACDLAYKAGVVTRKRMDPGVPYAYYYGEGEGASDAFLPHEVVRWLGVNNSDPHIDSADLDVSSTLTSLNDSGAASFDEIADLIAANAVR